MWEGQFHMLDDLKQKIENYKFSKYQWKPGSYNFDKTKNSWLVYVEARDYMKALDDIFGIANYQVTYPIVTDQIIICRISVRCSTKKLSLSESEEKENSSTETYEWIHKENGSEILIGNKNDGKTNITDAFKRACTMWGIGRYLYKDINTWTPTKDGKPDYSIARERKRLWENELDGKKDEPKNDEDCCI